MKRTAMLAALLAAACQTATPPPTAPTPMKTSTVNDLVIAPDVPQRVARLPRTVIDYDRSLLNDNERQVGAKLVDASKEIDEIFWRQVSESRQRPPENLRSIS